MAGLADFRKQHPEYDDMPDVVLADRLHAKFYSDMPRDEFDTKMGLAPAIQPPTGRTGTGIFEKIDAGVRGAADAMTFGLADEIAAGLDAATSGGGRSPVTGRLIEPTKTGSLGERYNQALAEQRAVDKFDEQQNGEARLAGQLAGGVAGAAGLAKGGITLAGRAAGEGLAKRAGLGALEGAGYGAAYGAGSGEGVEGRVAGAAGGGLVGAGAGAALPVAAAGLKTVAKPFIDAVTARTNPAGFAAKKVTERLTADGRTVQQAASRIQKAARNGDSMSLADIGGENVKGLARTATNIPGPARERITAQANLSAAGQGDRLKRLVGRVFANPEGAYQTAKAEIVAARANAAKPFYDEAYKQPVPYTFGLEDILNTPAGRAGLAAAKRNSANRREPWAQWFASIDDAGNIIDKRRVPDTRALDETKRVLDQMVEAAKAQPDGSPFAKARATPESIAIQSVRDDLVKAIDQANPAYAKARAVALDNIQADDALEFGRNALRVDSRIIAQRMGKAAAGRDPAFNEGQQELARIGLAEAIRQKIDDAGYKHNALLKFFGSREQVAKIRPFFKSDADWKAFRTSIFNEARKRRTYGAVTGNSTTARQLLDAQDSANLGETVANVADVGTKVVTGRPFAAAMTAIQSGLRRFAGMTPEVAGEVGKLLMTRDPQKVRQILDQVRAVEASNISADQKAAALRQLLTNFAAGQAGRELAPSPTVPLVPARTMLAVPQ